MGGGKARRSRSWRPEWGFIHRRRNELEDAYREARANGESNYRKVTRDLPDSRLAQALRTPAKGIPLYLHAFETIFLVEGGPFLPLALLADTKPPLPLPGGDLALGRWIRQEIFDPLKPHLPGEVSCPQQVTDLQKRYEDASPTQPETNKKRGKALDRLTTSCPYVKEYSPRLGSRIALPGKNPVAHRDSVLRSAEELIVLGKVLEANRTYLQANDQMDNAPTDAKFVKSFLRGYMTISEATRVARSVGYRVHMNRETRSVRWREYRERTRRRDDIDYLLWMCLDLEGYHEFTDKKLKPELNLEEDIHSVLSTYVRTLPETPGERRARRARKERRKDGTSELRARRDAMRKRIQRMRDRMRDDG